MFEQVTVKSVTIIDKKCEVYDIQVYQDESFIVGDIVVHNSELCASRDGNIYKDLSKAPDLPAHINCRSVYVSYVDEFGIIGNRASVGGRNFRELARKEYISNNQAKGISNKAAREKWKNLSNSRINKLQTDQRTKYAKGIGKDVVGKVPAKTTYQDFLKRQPRVFVEDVLGKTKAKLFIDGDLPLTKFVARDNSTLTIKELYKKERSLFKKLNLKP